MGGKRSKREQDEAEAPRPVRTSRQLPLSAALTRCSGPSFGRQPRPPPQTTLRDRGSAPACRGSSVTRRPADASASASASASAVARPADADAAVRGRRRRSDVGSRDQSHQLQQQLLQPMWPAAGEEEGKASRWARAGRAESRATRDEDTQTARVTRRHALRCAHAHETAAAAVVQKTASGACDRAYGGRASVHPSRPVSSREWW